MHEVAVLSKIVLVLLGAVLLSFSLFPIINVASQLKRGSLKMKWDILSTLIVSFIVSYIFYAYEYWISRDLNALDSHVVPFILFFGGVLVLLVGKLAAQTTKDIRKIAILQHQSITDALMGIKNRRYFDKKLEEEVRMSIRYKLPLSLALIDIDDFKYVNDTYGHLVGDDVLKELAKDIKNIARETDIVARYGGEEIVIITPNTNKQNASILVERLRKIVEKSDMVVLCGSQEIVKITVSIGVASINFDTVYTTEQLIQQADKALYKAKEEGKNRVMLSSE
jgi:diguanylate cyclase (GGDEF)-like protein